MNAGRTLRRTIRPIWVAGLAAAAWINRRELRSALGRRKPPSGDPTPVVLVPAAGETVTVHTTTATWAKPRRRFHRRTTVPGHAGNHLSADLPAPEKPAFQKDV